MERNQTATRDAGSLDALVRRRYEHNESVLEKCVAIMREHDKRAEMANFARCGCEFCKVVRHYEPPNATGSATREDGR